MKLKLPETPIQPSQQKTPFWQKTRKALRSLAAGGPEKPFDGREFCLQVAAALLTFALMLAFAHAEAQVAWGSKGEDVRKVQQKLIQYGYRTGSADGVFGKATYDAVVWFQRKNGLNVDGVVGASTAAALGISLGSAVSVSAYQESDSYLLARLVHGEARGEPYVGKVAVAAVVLTAIFAGRGGQQRPLPDGDGDNPSSIVDIFGSKATTIPRIQGDKGVRLTCQDPQGQPLTAQEVYAKVNPSVVTVVSEQADGASIGTGVIMTSDGYIITNAHVISGGKSCWVALDTGVTYDVKLVGYDEEEDLAVLKADPQNPLPAAEFGNSDLVQVGDTAYAIGNPLGVELRGTMTNGIISAINRAVEVDGKSMTLLQTNAALNNGNSGGPLINAYGQVIGINTLKMSTTDDTEATVEGLGFALPISSVSFVVNDIIATGSYRGAPSLGITVTTVEKDGGGTQVQVVEVSGGSGAADAGIQAGDVILAADGQSISVTSDLLTVRRSHVIGDTVTLTILRDGQQFDVEVVLRSNRSFG